MHTLLSPCETRRWSGLLLCAAVVLSLKLTGCAWSRPKCVMQDDVDLPQMVGYLNRNIERLQGWRCDDATIKPHGPFALAPKLSAIVTVQRGRKFRLMGSGFSGPEVDIGSNDERFWFWLRRSDEPGVFTCRHEDVQYAKEQMPMPFEPDWLIDCLGVVPIDPAEVTWDKHQTDPHLAFLRRERVSPEGRAVQLVSLVDTCKGVILEHSLVDVDSGKMVARAVMNEFLKDGETGIPIAHTIVLTWPQQQLGLTLRLGRIRLNPTEPVDVYAMPDKPNYPVYDLGQHVEEFPISNVSVEDNAGRVSLSDVEE